MMNNFFAQHLCRHAETYRKDGWQVKITESSAIGSLVLESNIPLYQPSSFVYEYFEGKSSGTFLDVGAADGVLWSNTCGLEEFLNWTGVLVEPQNEEYTKLTSQRSSVCFNVAISHDSSLTQHQKLFCRSSTGKQISGFWDNFCTEHKIRILEYTANTKGTIFFEEVSCLSIADVWQHDSLDYLSIDVEGSEWVVLNSLKSSSIRPKLISVEFNMYNLSGNAKSETILKELEYKYIRTVCNDRFYHL